MFDGCTLEGERLDDLLLDGMKVIQRSDQFCFSLDSVLLAHYVDIKKKDVVADLGTGTGVISLLLSALGVKEIVAFEVNPVMADLAHRNVIGNHKEDVIQVVNGDYREMKKTFPSGSFSSVVVNPPYREVGTGRMSPHAGVATAGYEIHATLKDVFETAQYLLKYGGRLTMVHRADRLADLITLGRMYHMEAKRLRLIYTHEGRRAVRLLMEWRYGGHAELTVDSPLFIHEADGSYTKEVMEIYGKAKDE